MSARRSSLNVGEVSAKREKREKRDKKIKEVTLETQQDLDTTLDGGNVLHKNISLSLLSEIVVRKTRVAQRCRRIV